jgi:hypothetical protein
VRALLVCPAWLGSSSLRAVLLLTPALLGSWQGRAWASTHEPRVYTTAPASQPPRIDGVLDDECWNAVEWSTDFVQWQPKEGDPPSEQTSFKILYDHDALYVAYRAHDHDPSQISNQLARRDWFPGDWVEINIDSYNDNRTAFSFTSSVSGTRGDEFVSNDGNNWDGNWDPVWRLATQIDAEGWTAEVMIPLSQLRFASQEEHVWGIQVTRRIFRKEERSIWQPMDKDEPGWVSRFGELRGIRGIQPRRRVEVLPYTVGKAERFETVPGDPYLDGQDGSISAGVDGKVGVTPDLTLDFTINPDFGQVEADPSEVNLTAFETFFAEKRPFFIEGNNIFDFRLSRAITGGSFTQDNLFYSRRIGRQPDYYPDLDDVEYADVPDNTSIIGAFKLSGKTRRGLSVGVMESITAGENAHIDSVGHELEQAVEPLSNFFIGRLQQDLRGGDTSIGGIFTAVNRSIDEPQLEYMHRSAYSGGFDLLHEWSNKSWYVAATGAVSHVSGDATALLQTQQTSARYFQRPDNDYESVDSTRTSLSGVGGSFRFARGGGGNLRFETGVATRSPGFEVNDIGFMRRADETNQFTWVGYSIRNPFAIFRSAGFNGNQWLNWDHGGTRLSEAANVNFNLNFKNNWWFGAGTTRNFEYISNTALRGGPSSLWPGDWNANFWVDSDSRKTVVVNFGGYMAAGDEDIHDVHEWWFNLAVRPTNALRVAINPSYVSNQTDMQYVSTPPYDGNRYLFGRLDQETGVITFRIDYTLTPNLTLQYYGSPFVSAGEYTEFKHVDAPRATEYKDRFHTYTEDEITVNADGGYAVDENADNGGGPPDYSFDNPDFNVQDFNSNLVLRWEFQPGSTMFLVWNQSRSGYVPNGHFAFRDDMNSLFDEHPHNVFLLKVNKWFSL